MGRIDHFADGWELAKPHREPPSAPAPACTERRTCRIPDGRKRLARLFCASWREPARECPNHEETSSPHYLEMLPMAPIAQRTSPRSPLHSIHRIANTIDGESALDHYDRTRFSPDRENEVSMSAMRDYAHGFH
jgi:hypothetical protein